MKFTAIFITIFALFGNIAHAGDLHLQIAGFSKHSSKRMGPVPWNENNPGLGLRYAFTPEVSAQVGFYKNSYSQRSAYLLADYTPLLGGRFGVFGGYLDGYQMKYPVGGGLLYRESYGPYNVTFRAIPPVLGNQVGVVAVEFGVQIK